MTDFDNLRSQLVSSGIMFIEHERPKQIECARTVACFSDDGTFTHWVAKDETLVMVADQEFVGRQESEQPK